MPLIVRTTGFDDYMAKSGGAYIKCLILGEPDSGKTRSASFWPNPIFADCEQGRMSIADRGVPYVEVKSSRDMDALIAHLKQECMKPVRKYDTLVIDTLDSYQRTLIAERLAAERKESLSGWADWGYLDAKIQQALQGALNLPMNIVVNVHIKDEGDGDDDNRVMVKKAKLKGDIRDAIAGEFDLIGYLEKSYVAEGGKRVLKRQIRWHSEPRYPLAKDRSGRLPRWTDVDFSEDDYQRIHTSIVGDHVEAFPESGVLETLDNGEVEPAPADTVGGPVKVDPVPLPRKAPTKRAATKAAAKKSESAGSTSVPAPDPAGDTSSASEGELAAAGGAIEQPQTDVQARTDVAEPAPAAPEEAAEPDEQQAIATVTEAFPGAVVEQELPVEEPPAPAETEVGPRCGEQPPHFRKFTAQPGCGKGLGEESRDAINLRMIKTKTFLCSACFTAWKASQ